MKRLLLICVIGFFASCATPGAVLEKAESLDYGKIPAERLVLAEIDAKIRPALKDPESLKNLHIVSAFKCYASKLEFSDNVSPKYSYGYWCFEAAYQATNSFGGFVTGSFKGVFADNRIQTLSQLGETVRKHDDVYTYWEPALK